MEKKMIVMKAIIQADYKEHTQRFKKIETTQKVIIIGDSLVAYLPLIKYNLEDEWINLGIPGDTTEGVINRLDDVIRLKPKTVIISIGSNDLVLTDLSIEHIVKNIIQIKESIHRHLPHSQVFIMDITPVLIDQKVTHMAYVAHRTNMQIESINELLNRLLDNEDIIDVAHRVMDASKNLSINLTKDGIHLNQKGYDIYVDAIVKRLR